MNKLWRAVWVVTLLHSSGLLLAQAQTRQQLSIEDMFELAEANSKSIRLHHSMEQEAEQAVKVAKNAQLPSLDVSISGSFLGNGWITDRDFTHGQTAHMPHWSNNFAIEATQVIYAGGAISGGISMAKLQHQIAQLDKETNRQDIRFLLIGNYLELYKLYNQAEVYVKNIEQTQRLVADIKAKEHEGLALKNDITRYELQLKTLELALTQVENSQTILNNQLVTVLGLPQETIIDVDRSILDQLPVTSTEAYWQSTALDVSPTLQQAKLGIEQSLENEKVIRAERLPSLALFAGNHLDGPITIEVPPINKNFNYWYVGLGIKYNIASLYTSNKKSKLAKLSTQRAIENEQLLHEHTQTGIKSSYVRFIESFTIYDTQIKSLELAEQNYNVINKRYLNDLALITDMLDASNSKLSAELQVANARINILFNYYNLKKSSGTL